MEIWIYDGVVHERLKGDGVRTARYTKAWWRGACDAKRTRWIMKDDRCERSTQGRGRGREGAVGSRLGPEEDAPHDALLSAVVGNESRRQRSGERISIVLWWRAQAFLLQLKVEPLSHGLTGRVDKKLTS